MRLVARRPDFLLPFRQKAPTIDRALNTIYSDPGRLFTSEGFWNILTFRGMTYGSLYAKNDLEWFDSYPEWDEYYTASDKFVEVIKKKKKEDKEKQKGKEKPKVVKKKEKEPYFVNMCAYGVSNKRRSIENASLYWAACDCWSDFIENQPNVEEVYKFLTRSRAGRKVFQNIGDLTALLICGDLVEVGILQMPLIEEWAGLIYDVKKGATLGLQCLGLLGETFSKEEVIDAFKSLDTFLFETLSDEDQELMGYNIIMLEHSLCKFTRILPRSDKPIKASRPKKPSKKKAKLMASEEETTDED